MGRHPACDRRQAAGDVVSDIAEDLPDQRALSGFLWLDRATVMIHQVLDAAAQRVSQGRVAHDQIRSEEHTSELQSLMRISYAVFCLKKKISTTYTTFIIRTHNHSH